MKRKPVVGRKYLICREHGEVGVNHYFHKGTLVQITNVRYFGSERWGTYIVEGFSVRGEQKGAHQSFYEKDIVPYTKSKELYLAL